MQDLKPRLDAICDAQPFGTTWYFKDLLTGQTLDRDGETVVPSASTRKLSILMAAYAAAERGKLDLKESVPLEPDFNTGVFGGTLRFMNAGHRLTVREALIHMIITSDNVGTRIVTDRLPQAEINRYCQSIGLTGTVHRQGVPAIGIAYDHPLEAVTTTTAGDSGRLLEMILQGTRDEATATRLGCSVAACRDALAILGWQLSRDRIPALLPLDTPMAGKSGGGRRGQMDAGIVYRGGEPRYIISVYTDYVPPTMPDGLPGHAAAFLTIARLSRTCWDTLG